MENITIKTIAVRNIKKHTNFRPKEDIKKYVHDNFVPQYKEFALGYPIEFFTVISNGIDYLLNKKK